VADPNTPVTPVHVEPVRAHRAFEIVSDRIRDKLAKGELRPGDKLPAERELATQLSVSRSAVREALRSLEVNGVVELKKGVKGGAFILGGSPDRMAQAMQDLVSLDTITLKELTEARILLLDGVVRLAVARMNDADLAALEANIARTEQVIDAGNVAERPRCAQQFYHLLAASTRNNALAYLVDAQTSIVQRHLTYRKWNMPKDQLLDSRRRFVAHLRARDAAKAAEELKRHLKLLQDTLWT
jgi:GntR family transcriptional repressor for pyruvate dehydrogenase complex